MEEKFEMTKERMKEIRSDAMLIPTYEGIENVRNGIIECFYGALCAPKHEKEYTLSFSELQQRIIDRCNKHKFFIYWEEVTGEDDSLHVQFWIYRYRYFSKILKYLYSLDEKLLMRTWLLYKLQGYSEEIIMRIIQIRHHPSVFGSIVDDPDTVY